MKQKVRQVGSILIGLILIHCTIYGTWRFQRWFNWKQGYGSKVKIVIIEMVKQECLIGQ